MAPKNSIEDHAINNPDQWVDQYGDLLYRFAMARVKDPSIAEDLVQETFLAALHSRDRFEGRSKARTWLIAILKHKIIDHIRRKMKEQTTDKLEVIAEIDEQGFDENGKWHLRPNKWDIHPDTAYRQKEFMETLYRCLADIPDRLAQAFILREIDDYSTDEICKALGITATNSWVMLYRARMSLRQCLEKNWFDTLAVGTGI